MIMSQDLQLPLVGLGDNIKLMLDQLENYSPERIDSTEQFVKEEFWKQIIQVIQKVSHEATKLSLVFSKPPLPDAASCKELFATLEMSCLTLVSVFYRLPEREGLTIRKELLRVIRCIFSSVHGLVGEIQSSLSSGKAMQLQMTGTVWKFCESIEKMPQDNRGAVSHVIGSHSDLVSDALEELTEAIENANKDDVAENLETNNTEEEEEWCSGEKDIAIASVGLVKVAQCCMKKTSEVVSVETSVRPSDLDNIAEVVVRVSPAIDDFVSSLYPPMRKMIVMETAIAAADCLRFLISEIKNILLLNSGKEASWTEFLQNTIDHNLTKVENLTGKNRLG